VKRDDDLITYHASRITFHYSHQTLKNNMPSITLKDFITKIRQYNPDANLRLLRRSYHYSETRYEGKTRLSGEPFFVHCQETANILINLHMDISTICAGLLHDVLEDGLATSDELRMQFGKGISDLVEGLTKISAIQFKGKKEQRQVENYRKMLLAMAGDVRVILIKLADRLHNMRTLQYLPANKQLENASETLELYAPLAHRLGIASIKSELEDLSFKYLDPEAYYEIAGMVHEKKREREAYTQKTAVLITESLKKEGVNAQVFGRPKHFYSIYQKIYQKGTPFSNIYDLIAFRVLVDTIADCYSSLGIINTKWTPVPSRLKDYIGFPKTNGYQSLHTTVLIEGKHVEVQIRTHEMHQVAEYGIAAHWSYKEGIPVKRGHERQFAWLRQLIEQIQEFQNPRQFMQSMKAELFPDEVYVFTPKGDLKAFPVGATPIDFAYSIHTDIGNTCTGAKINSSIVPLSYELKSGDIVHIITDPNAKPSRKWLKIAKTNRAKDKIRRFLREQQRAQSLEMGLRLFEAELRKRNVNPRTYLKAEELLEIAQTLQFQTIDELLVQVGSGKISARHLSNMLFPEAEEPKDEEPSIEEIQKLRDLATDSISIDGFDRTMVRISKCCNPVPGDKVLGFITRGRGVSVHRADCPKVFEELDRVIPVQWNPVNDVTYPAEILVESSDRTGLLRDIAAEISKYEVNISKTIVSVNDPTNVIQHFWIDVTSVKQLQQVMNAIMRVKNVRKVERKGAKGL